VILLDVNLLLYVHDRKSKEHERSFTWLREILSGPHDVGLSWHTILSFLRISTDPRMVAEPLEFEVAIEVVKDYLDSANVEVLEPTSRHWSILVNLLPKTRVRGSLIMDAHLAALAIEHGATLCTNDRDFARFPGLKVEFPLQDSI
jgi:toxin-antitoxin system PIN domain toxin